MNFWISLILLYTIPNTLYASTVGSYLHAEHNLVGTTALIVFGCAYIFVVLEEKIQLRKSKPVILCAGIIWMLVAYAAKQSQQLDMLHNLIEYSISEYGQLFLFLLVAMTYVNAMEERNTFMALQNYLTKQEFSYKTIFWITGILAFFISAIADNLTTALLMCAVITTIGRQNKKFVSIACVNIVVAANAGGAFSPFGDITTLMVWQKGVLSFFEFFKIFIPSLVNFLVPACFMHFALPNKKPSAIRENVILKPGAITVMFLFIMTISLAVFMHIEFNLPPMLGMMTGLGLLQIYGYYIKIRNIKKLKLPPLSANTDDSTFDIFHSIAKVEWDTLLFFYGVMLCVSGLAAFGYLDIVSHYLYHELNFNINPIYQATIPNTIIGLLSAIIDNIPVMYAVLTMNPNLSDGQWLLITLTTGTGGSLLAIGSAAGVAIMGQAKGLYTFSSHLRWSWAILLGYFASIVTHLLINRTIF